MTSRRTRVRRVTVPALLGAVMTVVTIMTAFGGDGADPRIPFPPPASHAGKWLEYHGRAVGAGGSAAGRPGAECTVCHDRADCIACHVSVMPRDHTGFWRTRVHGLMAAGNAGRCAVCHREDHCIRCHQETAPRTHTASWRSRHCSVCHFGAGQTIGGNCSVCHKRPGHPAAPHPVNPGLVCTQCHR